MKRLKVREGTQVTLDGRLHGAGKEFDTDEATAARLTLRGIATEVEEKPKKPTSSKK